MGDRAIQAINQAWTDVVDLAVQAVLTGSLGNHLCDFFYFQYGVQALVIAVSIADVL